MRILIALAVLVSPAFTPAAYAQTCPPTADVSAELDALFERARAADDFNTGQAVSNAMWEVWLRAPDAEAQAMLDRGMAARGSFDFDGAKRSFDALILYCPEYAEGWNQRAFINFLREDYPAALDDLDHALELQPRHVAAQSGRGLALMNMGRIGEARQQMLAAVENNPWLSERALLAKGAPLGPVGEDI